jgi:ABC-type glycerol-3-phosphate transport system substrate-binding protein
MKKISRRSFLKVSGTMAAAGALAACGGSSSTSTAASSEAAPSVEAKAEEYWLSSSLLESLYSVCPI